MAFGSLRKLALQGFRDTGVKRPSRLAQQRAIRCVLHERMLEQVGRMRRHALPEKQAGGNETVERRSQLLLRLAYDRSQQGIRELAPNRSPDLRYLLSRAKAVETGHQRRMQACRDREGR